MIIRQYEHAERLHLRNAAIRGSKIREQIGLRRYGMTVHPAEEMAEDELTIAMVNTRFEPRL